MILHTSLIKQQAVNKNLYIVFNKTPKYRLINAIILQSNKKITVIQLQNYNVLLYTSNPF